MLTLALSLLVGALVGGLVFASGLVHSAVGAILPGVLAMLGVAFFLLRRSGQFISGLVDEAGAHMKGGRKELAMRSLREGLKYSRWNPLLEGQLRAQIGILLYASNDLEGSIKELEQSTRRMWEARAYLGCAYYKKKNDEGMKRAFDDAIKAGEKDGLAYTVYAWCLLQRDKRADAIAVLKKGQEKLPNDDRLTGHIEAIQEGKKLKVGPYGDRWASFLLDGTMPGTQQLPKAMRGYAQRPGFRQKPLRPKRK